MASKRLDTSLFDRAVKFASDAHAGTSRKGKKIPYLIHPLEAAVIVATITEDQELIAAAVLHDVVEDTDATVDQLRECFGDRVADLVEHETILGEPEDGDLEGWKDRTWKMRKIKTIERLRKAPLDAKIVAMGDKLSNMRALNRDRRLVGESLWQRFRNQNPKDHAWYYRSLADALCELQDTDAYREFTELIRETFVKE